jgi:hypothetical protein
MKRRLGRIRCVFTVRSLLAVTVIASLAAWSVAYYRQVDQRELQAAASIVQLGGQVKWARYHRLPMLPRSRACVAVDLRYSLAGESDLRFLLSFSKLKDLKLAVTTINDQHLEAVVAQMDALEFLDVSGTQITDEGVSFLHGCQQLETLRLTRTKVLGHSFEKLAGLPHLSHIDADDTLLTNDGLKWISRCPNLKQLRASSDDLTDPGTNYLQAASRLEYLNLSGRFSDEGVAGLAALPSLQCVFLHSDRLTNESVHTFYSAQKFKAVDISGRNVSLTPSSRWVH